MKWFIIITFTLFSVSCSSSNFTFQEQILFDKVIAASKTNDIKNLSDFDYDQISVYISKGKARWIDLYPTLKSEPFPGMTYFQEGLNISMAYALSENPSEVLKFVDESNIGYICGIPFIEPTSNEVNSYYLKTSAAIKNLTSGGLWKNRCLSTLNRIMSRDTSTVK